MHDAVSQIRDGYQALTEREKETLRLLLGGHDAKSIAGVQKLSVHTVNERLREARRKLNVSSSRAAARLLAEAEPGGPNSLSYKQLGVADEAVERRNNEQPNRRHHAGKRYAWLGGGMLIMAFIIVAAMLSSVPYEGSATDALAYQGASSAASAPVAAEVDGAEPAREWLALVDGERWAESWQAAGTLFKSQVSQQQWASQVESVRRPFGPVSSRVLQSATKATSLPGAPAGEYQIVQFQTDFAHKSGAIETITLAREASGWKMVGYFIR